MEHKDIKAGMKILYMPQRANKDSNHPSVESGIVSSFNEKLAFIKFDSSVKAIGEYNVIPTGCYFEDLISNE